MVSFVEEMNSDRHSSAGDEEEAHAAAGAEHSMSFESSYNDSGKEASQFLSFLQNIVPQQKELRSHH